MSYICAQQYYNGVPQACPGSLISRAASNPTHSTGSKPFRESAPPNAVAKKVRQKALRELGKRAKDKVRLLFCITWQTVVDAVCSIAHFSGLQDVEEQARKLNVSYQAPWEERRLYRKGKVEIGTRLGVTPITHNPSSGLKLRSMASNNNPDVT